VLTGEGAVLGGCAGRKGVRGKVCEGGKGVLLCCGWGGKEGQSSIGVARKGVNGKSSREAEKRKGRDSADIGNHLARKIRGNNNKEVKSGKRKRRKKKKEERRGANGAKRRVGGVSVKCVCA